jgi:hypothetical protein
MSSDAPLIIVRGPSHQENSTNGKSDSECLVFAEPFAKKRDGECICEESTAVVHCCDVRGGGERYCKEPGTGCECESDGEGADDEQHVFQGREVWTHCPGRFGEDVSCCCSERMDV